MSEITEIVEKAPPIAPMDYKEWLWNTNKKLKAIWEKLEALEKALESISQDKLITLITREGATWTDFELPSSGVIVPAPGLGYKLQLLFVYFTSDADIVTSLRWTSTGSDMFPLQQKGVVALNLIGAKVREGGENEALYGYLSGTGTMKGSVLTKKVAV